MRFGFGLEELVLLLVIVVVVFGATKLDGSGGLSEAVDRFRARQPRVDPPHLLLRRVSQRRWSLSDWLLLGAALLLATAVITNALLRPTGGR